MKRIALFLAISMFFCVNIRGLEVSATSAVLYDPQTAQVLFEKNAGVRRGMASTTKIMTALVALEIYDAQQTVTINKAWCGVEGSSIYLKPGEKLKIIDIIYGLLLQSGNDAAEALSRIKTGDSADFVKLMNEKAAALGLKNTSFENPSGLDGENHYSTAADMARLASCAMENPIFRKIVSTKSIKLGERYFTNHNKLLHQIDGAVGVKTGFTKKCGRCLVSAVERNGRMLVAVTLGAPNDWSDHQGMYKYGFDEFSMRLAAGTAEQMSAKIVSGMQGECKLYLKSDISVFARASDEITTKIVAPPIVYAPITRGEHYGDLHIQIGGKTVATGELFFGETIAQVPIERSFFEKIIDKIKEKF